MDKVIRASTNLRLYLQVIRAYLIQDVPYMVDLALAIAASLLTVCTQKGNCKYLFLFHKVCKTRR